jgi:hypothetical protein
MNVKWGTDGIPGLLLEPGPGYMVVTQVNKNEQAHARGVAVGDMLVGVDDVPMVKEQCTDVAGWIASTLRPCVLHFVRSVQPSLGNGESHMFGNKGKNDQELFFFTGTVFKYP